MLPVRLTERLRPPPRAERIVHAWTERENLVLLSPRFERLRVPFSLLGSLRPFRDLSAEDRRGFRLDPDGSYLHWPAIDVHLGWSQLEALVRPGKALRREQESGDFNRRLGRAIRSLRKRTGLTQSRVEGLTDRHLRRIEKGEQRATPAALKSLARAHGLSTSAYFAELRATLDGEGV
jgi:hypothetical protein